MKSPRCLCLCMCILHIAGRQRLCKHLNAAMNTQATAEELLGASFSMRSERIKGKQTIGSSQNFS
jgi:hypothetical protein